MKLIENIKEMQEKIKNDIPAINCGGCIHFAFYFSEKLKSLNIPYKIYCFDSEPIGRRTYNTFRPVNHVVVYIERIGYIDGKKIIKSKSEKYKRELKLKNLDRLRWVEGWNRSYNPVFNLKLNKIINTYIK